MLVVMRAEYNGWLNPDDDGWTKPTIKLSPMWLRGFVWVCRNHPEKKSGEIRGIGRSGAQTSLPQAYARVTMHLIRYHGYRVTQECLETLTRQANHYVEWHKRMKFSTNTFSR